jgi:DNA-binding response OmpR family regulator
MHVIALIEDNPEIRETTSELLQLKGYEVHTAQDGAEGLTLIQTITPDVIVCDIMMPVLDGYELLKAIRTKDELKHIPFIFLTARVAMDDKLSGLDLGANDYITKPFEIKELTLRIRNIIEQRNSSIQSALSRPTKIDILSKDERFIADLNHAIENNIQDVDLSMSVLALKLDISTSSLQKKIKKISNKSVSQYIREFRLERAKDMIKSNYGSLKEISKKVGFKNVSYFSKTFKEYFGQSPIKY